jgi:hypothetical protein
MSIVSLTSWALQKKAKIVDITGEQEEILMNELEETQAWENTNFDLTGQQWRKVALTGRRRVTTNDPNFEGTREELEVAPVTTTLLTIRGVCEIIPYEFYQDYRWVDKTKIKVLGKLKEVIYET